MIMNKLIELIIVLFITIILFYIPYIIIKFIITYKKCKEERNHFYRTLPERTEKLTLQKILETPYILQYYVEDNKYIVWYQDKFCRGLEQAIIEKSNVDACIPESEIEINNSYRCRYLEKPTLVRTIERIFN